MARTIPAFLSVSTSDSAVFCNGAKSYLNYLKKMCATDR